MFREFSRFWAVNAMYPVIGMVPLVILTDGALSWTLLGVQFSMVVLQFICGRYNARTRNY